MATPPGVKRSWVEMLPIPWSDNPHVVVVLAPIEAKFSTRGTKDGSKVFGCMEYEGQAYGLQVLKPEVDGYYAHRRMFNDAGCDMVRQAWAGRLADVPQKLLTSSAFVPLVFNEAAMWGHFLNMREVWKGHMLPGSH